MNWKRVFVVTGAAVAGGAVCFFTAGIAAPALGAIIGGSMGLGGAAATSAGLAALGGGALAAGGGGMAAGTALVTSLAAGVGAAAAGGGAVFATAAAREERRCPSCDALVEQKDRACGNCGAALS